MSSYTLPQGYTIHVYASTFYGGLMVAELLSPDGWGLLFPVPPNGIEQRDIDAAVDELSQSEAI